MVSKFPFKVTMTDKQKKDFQKGYAKECSKAAMYRIKTMYPNFPSKEYRNELIDLFVKEIEENGMQAGMERAVYGEFSIGNITINSVDMPKYNTIIIN